MGKGEGGMSLNVQSGTRGEAAAWLGLAFAVGLYLLLAGRLLGLPLVHDEAYHLLAARAWLDSGDFSILDGTYRRARLYTIFVALWGWVLSDSVGAVRVSSVLAGSALVVAVFLFARRHVDRGTAAVAAVLLAFTPSLVMSGVIVRFYALHALVFFVFAALVYELVTHPAVTVANAARLAILAICVPLAVHLQPMSYAGIMAVGVAALVVGAPRLYAAVLGWNARQRIGVALGVLAAAVAFWFVADPPAQFARLRVAPMWAEPIVNDHAFYVRLLREWYPEVWLWMPFLFLVGLMRAPRVTLYCAFTFGVGFAAMSLGAPKAPRYITFLMPFLFIPVACGAVYMVSALYQGLSRTFRESAIPNLRARAGMVAAALIGVTLLVFVSAPPLPRGWLPVALGSVVPATDPSAASDWVSARPVLEGLRADYPVIVASTGVKAVYFLGDLTVDLNASVTRESDTGVDFGRDTRTGRPVIAQPEAMARVMELCPAGMVIVEAGHAGTRWSVPAETMAFLDERAIAQASPGRGLYLWTWDSRVQGEDGVTVAAVPDPSVATEHCLGALGWRAAP